MVKIIFILVFLPLFGNSQEMITILETMPRFPGCEEIERDIERDKCAKKKMFEYIYGNMKFPKPNDCVEGVVVVQFAVDTLGYVRDAKIKRNLGAGTGEEVLRVVNSMNSLPERWIPSKQGGKAINALYTTLPVRFKLE